MGGWMGTLNCGCHQLREDPSIPRGPHVYASTLRWTRRFALRALSPWVGVEQETMVMMPNLLLIRGERFWLRT